ncbi:MAG: TonB family protein [Acidobacteria bacterium]|nr:TonB family protein [Acidobacteriota bacterium]
MAAERLGLIEERGSPPSGVLISLLVHAAIVILLIAFRAQSSPEDQQTIEYVDLVRQATPVSPSQTESLPVTDAPGPEVREQPDSTAPLSDANRIASTPDPQGAEPSNNPGPGAGLAPPGLPGSMPGPPEREEAQPESVSQPSTTAPLVDWNRAIQAVTPPGDVGAGSPGAFGGDEGFAVSGPVSFETQWYPWGDYSVEMIRRIRHYWYRNMPDLIRLGIQGNVVYRFTIQRDGEITNIEMLRPSGSPPYDFAARKAIELSSALPPLPGDFPGATERVTVSFFYNMEPPKRRD